MQRVTFSFSRMELIDSDFIFRVAKGFYAKTTIDGDFLHVDIEHDKAYRILKGYKSKYNL